MLLAGKPVSECVSVHVEFGLDLFREEKATDFAMGE